MDAGVCSGGASTARASLLILFWWRLGHDQRWQRGAEKARTEKGCEQAPPDKSLARQASLQAATNDSLQAVAEAYFNVLQARGELAGAEDTVQRTEELLRRAEGLAPNLAPPVEVVRTRAELARRRQFAVGARERWRTASAELVRLLRLDASALVNPLEPPDLRVTLIRLDLPLDNLIEVGLLTRPELAAQRALVQATLERLRQERLRPLVPSVLLRGTATNPAGTFAAGPFGGGTNEFLGNFGARGDFDIQLVWQLDNLGFGNLARVDERRAENRLARLELFRTQDRIAAEVALALAQGQSAADRAREAEQEVRDAIDSVAKNFEGLGQTKRAGNLNLLVIRPQEAVAAVQALGQAYIDYYTAVGDHNRAQFRLYRALGQPAHLALAHPEDGCVAGAPAALPPAHPVPTAGLITVKRTPEGQILLRDVASVEEGTMAGEVDRYNMRRMVSITANAGGEDLGRVAGHIAQALKAAGEPPRGVTVAVRGQVAPMEQLFTGLTSGLGLAVIVILLLLTAYFQSLRLALIVASTVPAVLAGVVLALLLTGTTLNIQSFMGAIMAIGVAVANAILLLTFAERSRLGGAAAVAAAVEGSESRLRPILMTSCAMLAGMVPMALAFGEGGEQTAPLGRAVIGGLIAATLATLTVLPAVFALVQVRTSRASPSLHPQDPDSRYFAAHAEKPAPSEGPALPSNPHDPQTGIQPGAV